MAKINKNYQQLKESYLFSDIAKRVAEYSSANPEKKVIRMGIGDVTLPLPQAAVDAMKTAADEMSIGATFRGYGPEQGYSFLREAVQSYYKEMGVSLEMGDIFISDGAKSDIANLTDLFSNDNTILIPDPVYPVYVDTNIMCGRKIVYLDCNRENGFLPVPPDFAADIVYLCSPNNPTGAAYNAEQLKAWVDYANRHGAIILYDAAYEAFIGTEDLPRSIYLIEGAKTCAIEVCSLSKTAGFTGTRCGYTIVPIQLIREGASLNAMWNRRQTTKFNGVPYIIQRGAEAVFAPEGRVQIKKNLDYYMGNALLIAQTCRELGFFFAGGENSPYIWLECPNGMDSWSFFDKLLQEAAVVGTPGAGFGKNGEGYFRLSSFGDRENVIAAMERLRALQF